MKKVKVFQTTRELPPNFNAPTTGNISPTPELCLITGDLRDWQGLEPINILGSAILTGDTKDLPSIGYILKYVRNLKGLTQKELADLIGIPQARISEYESDKVDPSAKMLQRILNACMS